jgi:CRP-like cAMP-binding protein
VITHAPGMDYDTQNSRLLHALPRTVFDMLQLRLEPIHLREKEVLLQSGEPMRCVYFPTTAVLSLLTVMHEGPSIELATIGNEGLLGLPLFLGVNKSLGQAVVDLPGRALRMNTADFAELCEEESFSRVLRRYSYALFMQIAQYLGCNRFHSFRARCARTLLLRQDRTSASEFLLTQESLAGLLGVRRATVNVTITELEREGLVSHRRGKIKIENRQGLQTAACECYRRVKDELAALFPNTP